jgi:hypothetical protein
MLDYLKDRNFLSILHFMGDLLNHLGEYSKKMQHADGLMIDQARILETLIATLIKASSRDDVLLKSMYSQSICNQQPQCDIDDWEDQHSSVQFRDINTVLSKKFQLLSGIRSSLINLLVEELKSYFPFSELNAYKIQIPESTANQHHYGIDGITKLATKLQLDVQTTVNQWRELMEAVTKHPEFCDRRKGHTKYF